MTRTAVILIGAVLAVLLSMGTFALLETDTPDRTPVAGTLLEPPRPIADFTLIDQSGQMFNQEQLKGQWSLVFFGFTQCEGVCPMTLARLSQAVAQVEQAPTVIFVSVDTKRDAPEVLARYIRSFSDDFIGITGDPAEIDKLTQSLFAPYSITGEGANYAVDHSSTVFLIDPDGRFAALFSAPIDVKILAEDIRKII
jgi:protein SCO1/2